MAAANSGREAILDNIRRSLGRPALSADAARELEQRIKAHKPNLVPARAKGGREEVLARFVEMAEAAACGIHRVKSADDVPEALAAYLRQNNLPNEVTVAPTGWLEDLPWDKAPMLTTRSGLPTKEDLVSLTPAYAAVAETGTLIMASGPEHPTSLNLTPDHHVVALRASQICGGYEEVWAKLRKSHRQGRAFAPPRTINMITGPSRTGDIGLTIYLGAHGPRALHIILIEDGADDGT